MTDLTNASARARTAKLARHPHTSDGSFLAPIAMARSG
jgi:hypothetical protein